MKNVGVSKLKYHIGRALYSSRVRSRRSVQRRRCSGYGGGVECTVQCKFQRAVSRTPSCRFVDAKVCGSGEEANRRVSERWSCTCSARSSSKSKDVGVGLSGGGVLLAYFTLPPSATTAIHCSTRYCGTWVKSSTRAEISAGSPHCVVSTVGYGLRMSLKHQCSMYLGLGTF